MMVGCHPSSVPREDEVPMEEPTWRSRRVDGTRQQSSCSRPWAGAAAMLGSGDRQWSMIRPVASFDDGPRAHRGERDDRYRRAGLRLGGGRRGPFAGRSAAVVMWRSFGGLSVTRSIWGPVLARVLQLAGCSGSRRERQTEPRAAKLQLCSTLRVGRTALGRGTPGSGTTGTRRRRSPAKGAPSGALERESEPARSRCDPPGLVPRKRAPGRRRCRSPDCREAAPRATEATSRGHGAHLRAHPGRKGGSRGDHRCPAVAVTQTFRGRV